MDISRKTDYALRMLAMLAEDPECLLSVRTAAEEVNVPYSFARSIQHGLVQAGIVESLRGVHGGMRLKVSPDDVTIAPRPMVTVRAWARAAIIPCGPEPRR